MADINFENDFFSGVKGMMMGFGGLHSGMNDIVVHMTETNMVFIVFLTSLSLRNSSEK